MGLRSADADGPISTYLDPATSAERSAAAQAFPVKISAYVEPFGGRGNHASREHEEIEQIAAVRRLPRNHRRDARVVRAERRAGRGAGYSDRHRDQARGAPAGYSRRHQRSDRPAAAGDGRAEPGRLRHQTAGRALQRLSARRIGSRDPRHLRDHLSRAGADGRRLLHQRDSAQRGWLARRDPGRGHVRSQSSRSAARATRHAVRRVGARRPRELHRQ